MDGDPRLPPLCPLKREPLTSAGTTDPNHLSNKRRTATPLQSRTALGPDVVQDPLAATYVQLWRHNQGKWHRFAQVEKMASITRDATDALDVERVLREEEVKRLAVLKQFAQKLVEEVHEGVAREEEFRRRLDVLSGPAAFHAPLVRSLHQTVVSRSAEADALRADNERKKLLLARRQEHVRQLKQDIEENTKRAEEKKRKAQLSMTVTLSEYLHHSDSGSDAAVLSSHQPRTEHEGEHNTQTSEEAARDEWLQSLRVRNREVIGSVFEESHASPLTMLLHAKGNLGHRREEVHRMLRIIEDMSPVKGADGSYNGRETEELFDVASVAAKSTALEDQVAHAHRCFEHKLKVIRNPELLRIMVTFQKYEDARGTTEYVATTPIEDLRKQQQQLLLLFQ